MEQDIQWLETVLTAVENTPNKQQITQDLCWLLVSVRSRLGNGVQGLNPSLHRVPHLTQQRVWDCLVLTGASEKFLLCSSLMRAFVTLWSSWNEDFRVVLFPAAVSGLVVMTQRLKVLFWAMLGFFFFFPSRLFVVLGGSGAEGVTCRAHHVQQHSGVQGDRPHLSHHLHNRGGSYDQCRHGHALVFHHFLWCAPRWDAFHTDTSYSTFASTQIIFCMLGDP